MIFDITDKDSAFFYNRKNDNFPLRFMEVSSYFMKFLWRFPMKLVEILHN